MDADVFYHHSDLRARGTRGHAAQDHSVGFSLGPENALLLPLRDSLGKFPDFFLFGDVKGSGKPLKFSDVVFPACPVDEFARERGGEGVPSRPSFSAAIQPIGDLEVIPKLAVRQWPGNAFACRPPRSHGLGHMHLEV